MPLPPPIPSAIEALAAESDALRDRLIAWAEINSGSANRAGLARMHAALAAEFGPLPGAQVTSEPLPGTAARLLRVRSRQASARSVLLSGHYDTVYDAGHPFQRCERVGERVLRGPGVADMKGGLVVMLAALGAFLRTPGADRLGWEVLLTPDEETGSEASAPALAETARRHRLGLVFEPARGSGDLVRSRMGTGSFTLTCHGRAAHAARVPNDGRNAIVALAEILPALHRLPAEMPGVLLNLGHIEGGGPLNIVPDRAAVGINLRTTRAEDGAVVLAKIRAAMAAIDRREGFRTELSGGFDRPPKECGPAEEAVFLAWQQARADLGVAPFSWVHAGGGSDGNLLSAAGLPNLDGLGPVGDHLHSERECCEWPTLVERARIAALMLHRFATGAVSLPGD